jgi:hypothetical protein
MKIQLLLTNPREFFREHSETPPSLKWPALIITLMAIFSAITGYQMGGLTGRLLSGIMQGMGMLTAIATSVSSFFGPFFMWLIATIILYTLHKLFQGTGSFTRVAEIAGYGMLPLMLASFIGIILAAYYLPMVDISPVTSTNPDQINAAVQSMMLSPALHQFSLITTLLTIILIIWVANLWAFGFETCCGLEPKAALITAGVPVLVYIIYTLVTLFIFNTGAMT